MLYLFLAVFVGQIELLDSESFSMEHPLQAHHGSVDMLQTLTEVMPADERVYDTCRIVISAGSDHFIKLWELQLKARDDVQFQLQLLPLLAVLGTESIAH